MHLHHILLIMGGFGFWVSGLGESWLYLERIKCFVCLELGVPPSNVYFAMYEYRGYQGVALSSKDSKMEGVAQAFTRGGGWMASRLRHT